MRLSAMKILRIVRVSVAVQVMAASTAWAQLAQLQSGSTFLANAETDPNTAIRLYLNTAETIVAPVGTSLWLVGDISGNGIPTGQVTTDQIQNIANGVGDDQRFFTDTVPGQLLGSPSGKYQRIGISVPGSLATASIGLILWNDANHDGVIGDAGDTFGYYNIGVVPPPQTGNALYSVAGNVHADENLVTAVPEPANTAVAVGLLCLAGAFLRSVKWRSRRVNG
jgi:hypothetical protein